MKKKKPARGAVFLCIDAGCGFSVIPDLIGNPYQANWIPAATLDAGMTWCGMDAGMTC